MHQNYEASCCRNFRTYITLVGNLITVAILVIVLYNWTVRGRIRSALIV
jgi:hypothetical protein